ncbi:methyltransferase [Pseudorhodoferax sp. Leaf267]|nr:methyltransferase [Pseudorhodoferax sp. Leaf267]
MYARSEDPYGTRARFYEQRKRDVLLACLPRPRFRSCYEPGCGNGELTVGLAARCDALLSADFAPAALRAARSRTEHLPNVTLARHALPQDWPRAQRFDLIVLSEVGYFLALPAVREIAQCCASGLDEDGVLVACDWLPDFDTRATSTGAIHSELAAIGLVPLVTHAEDDFRLMVWSRDPRSVAQREGIR